MKAVVYYNYCSPDVLKYEDVEKPVPNDNEVLIKVRAASLNALDWRLLRLKLCATLKKDMPKEK